MIEIEKGFTIPKSKVGRPNEYPWENMEIGDSFKVEGKAAFYFSTQTSRASRTYAPKAFICRREGEFGVVRVWRVK